VSQISFSLKVLNAVRRIPPGRVATYGDIARLAGRPRACEYEYQATNEPQDLV
jgi:alkylated DNA nucleotide flippase Atl1